MFAFGRNRIFLGFLSTLILVVIIVLLQHGKFNLAGRSVHFFDPLYRSATTFSRTTRIVTANRNHFMIIQTDELLKAIEEAIRNGTLWSFAKSELSTRSTMNCSDRRRLGKDVGAMDQEPYSICFDAPYAPRKSGKCLVYSFGIANEWDFDDQIASEHQCKVLSFDPSMDLADNTTRESGVNFWKIGLSHKNFVCAPDGTEAYSNKNPGNWTMRTLRSVAKQFGHDAEDKIIDVLKVDVEGAEVEGLHEAVVDGFLQNHVMQLTLEWHLWFKMDNDTQNLQQLIKTHRELVTGAGFESFHLATRTVANGFFPLECFVNKNLAIRTRMFFVEH